MGYIEVYLVLRGKKVAGVMGGCQPLTLGKLMGGNLFCAGETAEKILKLCDCPLWKTS
jgi:hypothetical protein